MAGKKLTEQQRENIRKYFSAQQIAEPSDSEIDTMASILQYQIAPLTPQEKNEIWQDLRIPCKDVVFSRVDAVFAKRNGPISAPVEPPAGYVKIEDVEKAIVEEMNSRYMGGSSHALAIAKAVRERLQKPWEPTLQERIAKRLQDQFRVGDQNAAYMADAAVEEFAKENHG